MTKEYLIFGTPRIQILSYNEADIDGICVENLDQPIAYMDNYSARVSNTEFKIYKNVQDFITAESISVDSGFHNGWCFPINFIVANNKKYEL